MNIDNIKLSIGDIIKVCGHQDGLTFKNSTAIIFDIRNNGITIDLQKKFRSYKTTTDGYKLANGNEGWFLEFNNPLINWNNIFYSRTSGY